MATTDPYPWQGISELARLTEQDDCMNNLIRFADDSLLPIHVPPGSTLLDLGCGPGGWARATAEAYPFHRILGIDAKEHLISYAQNKAVVKALPNVTFRQGDFLDLSSIVGDEQIQFIHARFLKWFLPDYAAALKHWFEVLAPGGYLCLVESESQLTNSRAFNQLITLLARHLHQTRPNLVGSGISGSMGITLDLYNSLAEVGCEAIRSQAFALNFSASVEGRDAYIRDLTHGFAGAAQLSYPIEPQELRHLIEECISDLNENPQFRGIAYHLAVWGRKPE